MVSFGASKHIPINPLQKLGTETEPKPLYDQTDALCTILCSIVYSVSIDNTFDNPIRISSIIESDNSPNRVTNLSWETERT